VLGDPIFYVRVSPSGKNPEAVDQSSRIRSFEYEDCESKADKLKLMVDNFDLTNFDAPIWKTGNHVECSWGYEGNMSPVRQMKIQKVTGGLVLSVECLDESIVMNKVQRTRKFEYTTYSEVVRGIAAEYGFSGQYIHVDDMQELLAEVSQARMTDMQFITSIAKRYGWEFYLDFDGFHFHPRRLDKKPIRKFVFYTDPGRGDIITWNIENDIFGGGKAGGVTVKGRDEMKKKNFEVKANNETETGRTTLGPTGGMRAAIGAGKITFHETEEQARAAGSPIIPTSEKTEASAKRQAQGLFQKSQLQAVQLSMECVGDPQMLAKSVFEVQGIGKTTSGLYYCTQVNHKVGAGYKMSVKAKRDGKSSADTAKGQDFSKDKPKPEQENKGKPNTQTPADCDPTKQTCAPAPLVAKVVGGKIVFVEGAQ
jgi:phage protein D